MIDRYELQLEETRTEETRQADILILCLLIFFLQWLPNIMISKLFSEPTHHIIFNNDIDNEYTHRKVRMIKFFFTKVLNFDVLM